MFYKYFLKQYYLDLNQLISEEEFTYIYTFQIQELKSSPFSPEMPAISIAKLKASAVHDFYIAFLRRLFTELPELFLASSFSYCVAFLHLVS